MSKLLIAVKSSRTDYRRGSHDAIRNTWGQKFRGLADVRFFIGQNDDNRDHPNLRSDEVLLGSADDLMSTPWKVRDICQWTIGKVYSHIFLCDNNTYVNAGRLLRSTFEVNDYQGYFTRPPEETFEHSNVDPTGVGHYYQQCYPWASGKHGYFLSRSAFLDVAEGYPNKNDWAEDLWVGQIIGRGASLGYYTIKHDPEGSYSWAYPGVDDPGLGWMNEMHKAYQ